MQWWAFPTTPIRPSSSRSAIQICHSGRSRGRGFDMHSSTTSAIWPNSVSTTCREMSKSRSSTQTGALIPNGTVRSVCRYRGARSSRQEMCSRSSAKLGLTPSAGGSKIAAQPTCMWAVGVSTARNEASSGDRRLTVISPYLRNGFAAIRRHRVPSFVGTRAGFTLSGSFVRVLGPQPRRSLTFIRGLAASGLAADKNRGPAAACKRPPARISYSPARSSRNFRQSDCALSPQRAE